MSINNFDVKCQARLENEIIGNLFATKKGFSIITLANFAMISISAVPLIEHKQVIFKWYSKYLIRGISEQF